MVLFGLSRTLWQTLLTRFVCGLFNGVLTVCKPMASEMCSEKHQARGQAPDAV